MDESPVLTDQQAGEVSGKTVLAALTYLDASGAVIERKQIHGTVVRANSSEGIVLELPDGDEYALPPDFTSFQKAPPGEYVLESSGDVVLDPDYICKFEVTVSKLQ
jgi:hypothetical protein